MQIMRMIELRLYRAWYLWDGIGRDRKVDILSCPNYRRRRRLTMGLDVTKNVFYWSRVATIVAQGSGMHRRLYSLEGLQLCDFC